MYIPKISEKQHVSAIHAHHQVFIKHLRFYYINHVTEYWWGDLHWVHSSYSL